MGNDLISIVLPIYNGERYMRESIDSVLAQTYKNWELLILDDCSTDSTPEIAREYVERDKRIKYHRNEKNLRLPRNLNKGFGLAKGNFLTWTSDDNIFLPEALEKMHDALKSNSQAQFAFASCRTIDENGNDVDYIMVNTQTAKRLIGLNGVGACFMYTRKAYEETGDYDPIYTLVEDFDYWQRLAARYETVAIPEILYKYRFHSGALTSTKKQEVFLDTLEKMLLKNRELFQKVDMVSRYYYYQGLYRCRQEREGIENPYYFRYKVCSAYYFVFHRIPGKLRRMGKRIMKRG